LIDLIKARILLKKRKERRKKVRRWFHEV